MFELFIYLSKGGARYFSAQNFRKTDPWNNIVLVMSVPMISSERSCCKFTRASGLFLLCPMEANGLRRTNICICHQYFETPTPKWDLMHRCCQGVAMFNLNHGLVILGQLGVTTINLINRVVPRYPQEISTLHLICVTVIWCWQGATKFSLIVEFCFYLYKGLQKSSSLVAFWSST